MRYDHTQRGLWGPILLALAAAAVVLVTMLPPEFYPEDFSQDTGRTIAFVVGGILFFVSLMFMSLTVRDEGEALLVVFGPIPVLRKRFEYTDIRGFAPARSTFIDGWGAHYTPGRGWIYNIWGYDCVRLELDGKLTRFRIGTDDVEGLLAWLHERCPDAASGSS